MPAEHAKVWAHQGLLDAARDRIHHLDSGSSIGGVVVDPARFAMTVYWHGRLPAVEAAEIEADRSAGMSITVAAAAYTQAELLTEERRLITAAPIISASSTTAATITVVNPLPDGSGLDIAISGVPKGLPAPAAATTAPVRAPPASRCGTRPLTTGS